MIILGFEDFFKIDLYDYVFVIFLMLIWILFINDVIFLCYLMFVKLVLFKRLCLYYLLFDFLVF